MQTQLYLLHICGLSPVEGPIKCMYNSANEGWILMMENAKIKYDKFKNMRGFLATN